MVHTWRPMNGGTVEHLLELAKKDISSKRDRVSEFKIGKASKKFKREDSLGQMHEIPKGSHVLFYPDPQNTDRLILHLPYMRDEVMDSWILKSVSAGLVKEVSSSNQYRQA